MTDSRMIRIGILGGTFDPIHNGHLTMARLAYEELNLDKLLVIPAGRPYFKGRITPYDMRCEMVRIALEEIAGTEAGRGETPFLNIELCLLESDQEHPTYTYQTLNRLKKEYSDSELFFICGMDVLTSIGSWMKPDEVLRMATLAVFGREPDSGDWQNIGADDRHKTLTDICPEARCVFLHGHIPPVSSTQIRELVSRDELIDDLVSAKVVEYIRSKSLYRV